MNIFDKQLTEALEEVTRNYEVTGSELQLDNLESLLAWIQHLGNVGHSGTAEISVDGDGAARLQVKQGKRKLNIKKKHWKDADKTTSVCGTEFHVGLD